MNTPQIIWEGRVEQTPSLLEAILTAIKNLVGRKGRLLWVDVD